MCRLRVLLQEPSRVEALQDSAEDSQGLSMAEKGVRYDRSFWLAAAVQLAPHDGGAWDSLSTWLFKRSGCDPGEFLGISVPDSDAGRSPGLSGSNGADAQCAQRAQQALAAGCQALTVRPLHCHYCCY